MMAQLASLEPRCFNYPTFRSVWGFVARVHPGFVSAAREHL